MNRRHAAALALLGWYLLTPPIKEMPRPAATPLGARPGETTDNDGGGPRYAVDHSLPLSAWRIVDSFDSVDACRKAKDDLGATPESSGNRMLTALALAGKKAICVVSNDPRLAK
jgi:hypothetical protein